MSCKWYQQRIRTYIVWFLLCCVLLWFSISTGRYHPYHYGDVIMGSIASQITSLTIVYSTVYSDADQRKHQSSASLAFVWGIHRGPVNSPHKWPVMRKLFPFDDVIMILKDYFTGTGQLYDCPNTELNTSIHFYLPSSQNLIIFSKNRWQGI